MTVQKERLRRLMAKFGRSRFRYMEVKDGAVNITAVQKPGARKPVLKASDLVAEEEAMKATVPKPSLPTVDESKIFEAHEVTPQTLLSPRVGHFYLTDKKRLKEPILVVGQEVTEGQVIGMIESMNIRYEVKAEKAGVVAETLVEDGETVEYGQPLARLQDPSEAS